MAWERLASVHFLFGVEPILLHLLCYSQVSVAPQAMKITGSSEMNVLHYAAVEGADEAMACLVELSELILCQVLKSTLVGGS